MKTSTTTKKFCTIIECTVPGFSCVGYFWLQAPFTLARQDDQACDGDRRKYEGFERPGNCLFSKCHLVWYPQVMASRIYVCEDCKKTLGRSQRKIRYQTGFLLLLAQSIYETILNHLGNSSNVFMTRSTRKTSLLESIILPSMKYCSWVSLASDAVTSQLTFFLSMHQLLQYKRQQGNFLCFYFAYNTFTITELDTSNS